MEDAEEYGANDRERYGSDGIWSFHGMNDDGEIFPSLFPTSPPNSAQSSMVESLVASRTKSLRMAWKTAPKCHHRLANKKSPSGLMLLQDNA